MGLEDTFGDHNSLISNKVSSDPSFPFRFNRSDTNSSSTCHLGSIVLQQFTPTFVEVTP